MLKNLFNQTIKFVENKFILLTIIISSLLYISLTMHLPVSLYSDANHDDVLFWNNAHQLIRGHWFGPYNQMTLAKGPGFSFFLAFNFMLGFPITLSLALFYLLACLFFFKILNKLNVNRYYSFLLFALILFFPTLIPTRVIRDNIYPALTLLVIVGIIEIIFTKKISKIKILIYSLFLFLFWITREEGVWMIPGFFVLVSLKLIQLIKLNKTNYFKQIFQNIAIFFTFFFIFLTIISFINYSKYNYFGVVDFKSKAFSKVVKNLNKVKIQKEIPYLPVPEEKRNVIYKISPSFLELKDYFENEGKEWTEHGCQIYPSTCNDYAGGWFVWALRDSVANLGYYNDYQSSNQFYRDINDEINYACESNLIDCEKNVIPFMPKITKDQMKTIPDSIMSAIKLSTLYDPVPVFANESTGSLDQIKYMEKFLGRPLRTFSKSEMSIEIDGWFYSKNNEWLIITTNRQENNHEIEIKKQPSPDIEKYFDDPSANFQRFSVKVSLDENLAISTNSLESNKLTINELREGAIEISPNETLFIDRIVKTNVNNNLNFAIKIKIFLINLYKIILPVLMILGLFCYLIHLLLIIFKKNKITDLFIINSSLWILFFSRIFLLVLVDVSSFPAIKPLYFSPAFPIMLLASTLSIYLIFYKENND